MSVRLLIFDEQEIVRAGIKSAAALSDINVVGECSHNGELIPLIQQCHPDVVLFGLQVASNQSLATVTELRQRRPETPVVVYSALDNSGLVNWAASQGAAGYVLKTQPLAELLAVIRAAAAGQFAWTPNQIRRAAAAASKPLRVLDVESPLSDREIEVLTLLSRGLTNTEIAEGLKISYETVKEHVQHILRKISVTCRTQAAVWAVRNGLV